MTWQRNLWQNYQLGGPAHRRWGCGGLRVIGLVGILVIGLTIAVVVGGRLDRLGGRGLLGIAGITGLEDLGRLLGRRPAPRRRQQDERQTSHGAADRPDKPW